MNAIHKNTVLVSSLSSLLLVLAGCSGGNSPNFDYMQSLSMMDQHSLKAQRHEEFYADGRAMRNPPEGTVPRGFSPYAYKRTDAAGVVGVDNKNPLPRTAEILARGQKLYNTYCIVCHGVKGKGDGFIVPKFPMPPTLHSDKVRNWPDGALYHVIAAGQNLMPPYASQIEPTDRWAVVHYIRALQLSVNPDSTKPTSGNGE